MLFRQYLINSDVRVKLSDVTAPKNDFADFNAPLVLTLEHERNATASINVIYAEAYKLHDFRTMQFLDWFVREQGEEEKNSTDLIKKFCLFGKDSKGLYMLDQELGARVYAAPTLVL